MGNKGMKENVMIGIMIQSNRKKRGFYKNNEYKYNNY